MGCGTSQVKDTIIQKDQNKQQIQDDNNLDQSLNIKSNQQINQKLVPEISTETAKIQHYIQQAELFDEQFKIEQDQQLSQDAIVFGSGNFGQVSEFIDLKNIKIYAKKVFNKESYFLQECISYREIQGTIPQLSEYAITLYSANKQDYSLYFNPGLCSLLEYLKALSLKNEQLSTNNLKYIFKRICEFILLLKKHGYVHNDIKLENCVITDIEANFEEQFDNNNNNNDKNNDKNNNNNKKQINAINTNHKQIKLIDLGTCNQDLQLICFTQLYMRPPMRQNRPCESHQKEVQIPIFENQIQRYQAELFCLYRSINVIMLQTGPENEENKDLINNLLNQKNLKQKQSFDKNNNKNSSQFQSDAKLLWKNAKTLEEFLQLQQIAEKFYQSSIQKDTQLQQIMKFLNDFVNEKVNFDKLTKFLNQISESTFIDENQISEKIIIDKRKKLTRQQKIIDELQGINSYVNQKISVLEQPLNQKDIFDAFKKTEEIVISNIKNTNQRRVLIFLGPPGIGKTLFTIQLKRILEERKSKEKKLENTKIYFIKLSQVRGQEIKQYQFQKTLESEISKLYNKHKDEGIQGNIIFLLDGYDEFADKKKRFEKIFQLADRETVQLIITSRIDYQSINDLNESFKYRSEDQQLQFPQIQYILPFDNQQREFYIEKFLNNQRQMRKYYLNTNHQHQKENILNKHQYLEIFNQYSILKEMSQRPFTLAILLQIIQVIQKQHFQQKKLTQFSIYKDFVDYWIKKELIRCCDVKKDLIKNDLDQYYEIEIELDQQYNQSDINGLINDFQSANVVLAWQLYLTNQITTNFNLLQTMISNLDDNTYEFKQSQSLQQLFIDCSPFKRFTSLQIDNKSRESILKMNTNNMQEFMQTPLAPVIELEYIHKSVYEFYLSKGIYEEFQKVLQNSKNNQANQLSDFPFLSSKLVNFEPALIKLLGEQIQTENIQDEILKKLIISPIQVQDNFTEQTKKYILSANTLSILNASKFTFFNYHFKNTSFPNAILNRSRFLNCIFDSCDLSNVDLTMSEIHNCKFLSNNLSGITFGQKILEGHTSDITSVSFSSDGKYLVSGSWDASIRVWNVSEGKEELKFIGHSDHVTSTCFSQDVNLIASASFDKSIRIWSIQQKKEICKFEGHSQYVSQICFSPMSNNILASSSFDKSIRIWGIKEKAELFKIEGHKMQVTSICFNPTGKNLGIGGENLVKIWGIEQKKELIKFEGHHKQVRFVVYSPDGQHLASCSDDTLIIVYNVIKNCEIYRLEGHTQAILQICFSPDGKNLVSCSTDRSIRIWSFQEAKEIMKLEGQKGEVTSISFSPDGQNLASGSSDHSIRIWSISEGKEHIQLEGHHDSVNCVTFSPNSQQIASCSAASYINLWNPFTGEDSIRLEGHKLTIYSVSYSPNGQFLASGSKDKTIKIWNLSEKKEILTFTGHTQALYQVAFSPQNSNLLASTSEDKSIRFWDLQTGKEIAKFGDQKYSINFSTDAKFLISGAPKQICMWDTTSYKPILKFETNSQQISSVCFSPDTKTFAYTHEDKTIRIWSLEASQEVSKLEEGHTSSINSITYTKDNKYLISGSKDNSIRVWSFWGPKKDKEIIKLTGHTGNIKSINISPDNMHIVSGSEDRSVRIWSISEGNDVIKLEGNQSLIQQVCFSVDGKSIAHSSFDKKSTVLSNAENCKQIIKLQGHTFQVNNVGFTIDGKKLAISSDDNTIRVWSILLEKETLKLEGNADKIDAICFGLEGKTIASCTNNKQILIWNLEDNNSQKVQTKFENFKQFQNSELFSNFQTYITISPSKIIACDQTLNLNKSYFIFNKFLDEQNEILIKQLEGFSFNPQYSNN